MKSLIPIIQENMKDRGMVPEEWNEKDSASLAEAIGIEARKQKGPAIEGAADIYVGIYAALKDRAAEAGLDFAIQPAASTVFIQLFNRLNGNGGNGR